MPRDADGEVLAVVHEHQGSAIPEMVQHGGQYVAGRHSPARRPRRRLSGRRAPGRGSVRGRRTRRRVPSRWRIGSRIR